MKGIDALTVMTYNRTDKSSLSFAEKRDILYSMYCFRCVFDDSELKRASNILIKYGVSFVFADKPDGDGVTEITDGDKKAYKFDVYSPAFEAAVRNKIITGEKAKLPQKLTRCSSCPSKSYRLTMRTTILKRCGTSISRTSS